MASKYIRCLPEPPYSSKCIDRVESMDVDICGVLPGNLTFLFDDTNNPNQAFQETCRHLQAPTTVCP